MEVYKANLLSVFSNVPVGLRYLAIQMSLDLLNASFVFSFGLAINRISLPLILVKVSISRCNLDYVDGVSFLSSLISSS